MFFSVVIPTYNRLPRLKKCLESVLNQSHRDFEVLIADDGSIDETKQYIDELMKNDSRIKYFFQVNSGQPAAARNLALAHANGDWVFFLDSDDTWKDKKLEIIYKQILHNQEAVIVAHKLDVVRDGNFQRVAKNFPQSDLNHYEHLLINGNFISTSSVGVRRDIVKKVGQFNTAKNYIGVEDFDYWLRVLREGPPLYVNMALGEYHVHGDGNISSSEIVHIEKSWNVRSDHIRSWFKDMAVEKKMRDRLRANTEFYIARVYHRIGDFQSATRYYSGVVKSVECNILGVKKIIYMGLCLLRIKV